jgi:hypothetical protein
LGDYSLLERLLHRLALSSVSVSELLFQLERTRLGATPSCSDAIYVTGLARSGTTALLQALHATGDFSSSTYADMPFVLAPNLWAKVQSGSRGPASTVERAHGDGIRVGLQSAEAFEEVFWRMSCGDAYICPGHLLEHRVPLESVTELRELQRVVCARHGAPRYLAKNNNHLLRLRSLAPQVPDMMFLVVFRRPLEQSESLLRQHRRFLSADRFTRQYMTWLVHHEFGATHRPLVFNGADRTAVEGAEGAALEVSYWIDRWIDGYSHVLHVIREGHPNIIPVSHERLCEDPVYRRSLAQWVGVPDIELPPRGEADPVDASASAGRRSVDEASDVYLELDEISRRALSLG